MIIAGKPGYYPQAQPIWQCATQYLRGQPLIHVSDGRSMSYWSAIEFRQLMLNYAEEKVGNRTDHLITTLNFRYFVTRFSGIEVFATDVDQGSTVPITSD